MERAIRVEIEKAIEIYRKEGSTGNIDKAITSAGVFATLKELYHTAAISEAKISYKTNYRVKRGGLGTNEAWNKAVDTYLMQHNVFNTVEQINATTKKRVLEIISKGIQDGASVDQIVKMLHDDDIPLKRATLIVRTESVGAMNMGGMMGAISTGIVYQKKWNTAGDHRVRGMKPKDQFNHVILNGTIVDMEKPFNNGQSIMFPGDKRASAGNFCNCRCVLSYIAKRDERGRIMRYPELSPTMGVGADGKLSDILFQLIVGQIFAGILETVLESTNLDQ
jgi:hypothetical protein